MGSNEKGQKTMKINLTQNSSFQKSIVGEKQ